MHPVADPHVLQFAEPAVELSQRRFGVRPFRVAFAQQPGRVRPLQDQSGDDLRATRIERLRLREFIEQSFQLLRGAVRARFDQRRREMADGDRADPALGLRGLAGIVDDERVDQRRRAEQGLGRTARVERHRFAGQPFERPVRAAMDQRVNAGPMAQPEVEGDIGVARGQRGVVVVALAAVAMAAIGLEGEREIAGLDVAEDEGAVPDARVVGRIAPMGGERRGKGGWKLLQQRAVIIQRKAAAEAFPGSPEKVARRSRVG